MARFSDGDPDYLRHEQYRDGSNLRQRLDLHERFSINPQGWQRWLFDRVAAACAAAGRAANARACILDVGCGTGNLWEKNRARIADGWRVTLSDFSPGMVQQALATLGREAGRFDFEVADAQAIPHPPDCFDLVLANHMLYHVPDRDRALGEVRRVLRPGGRLVAATNGAAHLGEIEDLLARFVAGSERDDSAEKFGLESGAAQLARHFVEVQTLRYRDGLRVTESEPLVAYVRSTSAREALTAAAAARLRSYVDDEISRSGAFQVTKEAGVLIASRP
jgi:ubiquinone/menaquinone biosynthesis C-methylase UbiE